jgi:hypothetical protein
MNSNSRTRKGPAVSRTGFFGRVVKYQGRFRLSGVTFTQMLPTDVELLIRDSIDVYLKRQGYRPPRFGQRLLAQSFGGETIQPAKVAAVTAKEIEAVSSDLVTAIKNVIEKVLVNPYEGLQNDLIRVFDSEFDKCADEIRKFGGDTLKRLSGNTSASSYFNDRLEDARQARHLELKLLAAEVLKSDRKDNRILYNSENEPIAIIDGGDK